MHRTVRSDYISCLAWLVVTNDSLHCACVDVAVIPTHIGKLQLLAAGGAHWRPIST